MGGILTAQKIEDNISDEKGIKSYVAKICKFILTKMERECEFTYPDLWDFVAEKLDKLSEIEQNRVASIDIPADVFGELMSGLLSFGLEGDKKLIANNIGKRIGRWIYIVDAFDDYESDKKSGSYNPFVLLYGGEEFTPDNLISISSMLEAEMALVCSSLDLLDDDCDKNRGEIIKNILCIGMPASVRRICDKQKNKK